MGKRDQLKLLTFLYAATLTMDANVAQAQSTPAQVNSDIQDKELNLPDTEKGRIKNTTLRMRAEGGKVNDGGVAGKIDVDLGTRYIGGTTEDDDYKKRIWIGYPMGVGLTGQLEVRTRKGSATPEYMRVTSPNITFLKTKGIYKAPLGSLNQSQLKQETKFREQFLNSLDYETRGLLSDEERESKSTLELRQLLVSRVREEQDKTLKVRKKEFAQAKQALATYIEKNPNKTIEDFLEGRDGTATIASLYILRDTFDNPSYSRYKKYSNKVYQVTPPQELIASVDDKEKRLIQKIESSTQSREREINHMYKKVLEREASQRFHFASASGEVLSVQYDRINNKLVGVEMDSALFRLFRLQGHVSFQLEDTDIIFNLCADVNGTFRYTKYKSSEYDRKMAMLGVEARACAGVQFGKIGHLSNDFKVDYMAGTEIKDATGKNNVSLNYLEIEDTTRFSNIGGSNFGLYYKYRNESLNEELGNSNRVNSHIFGVSVDI